MPQNQGIPVFRLQGVPIGQNLGDDQNIETYGEASQVEESAIEIYLLEIF